MTDFLGNELSVGDEVVYIYSNLTGGRKLMKGTIDSICKGFATILNAKYACYDDDPTSEEVSRKWSRPVKVKSSSIYKI